jgi:hypothetical protein
MRFPPKRQNLSARSATNGQQGHSGPQGHRETTMNTKTFTAALTALTLAATLALPSKEAHARGGWAIGAGIVGAAIVGGAIAASAQPVYVGGYRTCRWVANYDRFGNFLGNSKVCRYY